MATLIANINALILSILNHLYSSNTQSLDQIQDDDLAALPFVSFGTSSENPSCLRRDDVGTDLFIDPKHADSNISLQDIQLSY